MNKEELINDFYQKYYVMTKLSKNISNNFLISLRDTLKALINVKEFLSEIDYYAIYNTILIYSIVLKKHSDNKISSRFDTTMGQIFESFEILKSNVTIEEYTTRHC